MTAPTTLGAEGRRLWDTISADFDIVGNEPAVLELCKVADRLELVRTALQSATAKDLPGLIGAEVKLMACWARLWRILGIPNSEIPTRGVSHAKK